MGAGFDAREGFIWFNGKLVPWSDAKIHVLNHGLHYASSVFEGARCYNGQIFKLREHTLRLFRSAELLDMRIPYTIEEIENATRQTIEKLGLPDAYLRPVVWRG